jgi:transcriptional regulator with XRE-family HTH domain
MKTPITLPAEKDIASSIDLGALVKLARKKAGIPIDQAALLAGVSKQFLSDLEAGKPTIQFDKAVRVARQFGIELIGKPRGLSALAQQGDGQ